MRTLEIIVVLFLLGSLSIHWQCNSTKKSGKGAKALVVELLIVKQDFNPAELGAYTTIDTATIGGDILTLKVSYSGGCADHKFTLYTNKKFKKSKPPQLKLFLVHDDGGDACREMKSEVLSYNIHGTRYSKSSTKTKLKINDYKLGVMYNY